MQTLSHPLNASFLPDPKMRTDMNHEERYVQKVASLNLVKESLSRLQKDIGAR
jgi:hypothetical protein